MEEKYDFVEEVIRKKPSRLRLFLKKCLALVGAALFLSAGVLVILFVFRDNLRDLLFDGEKQSTAGTKVSVTLADKDDANIESDVVRLEEIINKTLVMIYAGSAQDELLCTGKCRSKNNRGNLMLGNWIFGFDKEIENIIYIKSDFPEGDKHISTDFLLKQLELIDPTHNIQNMIRDYTKKLAQIKNALYL